MHNRPALYSRYLSVFSTLQCTVAVLSFRLPQAVTLAITPAYKSTLGSPCLLNLNLSAISDDLHA